MLVAVALAAVGNVGAIGSLAVDTVYDMINSHVHRPVLHRVFVLAQLERRDDLVLQFARAFAFPTTAASADAVDYSLAGLLLVPLGFYDTLPCRDRTPDTTRAGRAHTFDSLTA